jgi:glycerophosphoryl diester phosphodiesterase
MLRIGHRGACGYAPENTLAAMRKALELGVDGFEFDIQLSKDGIPVVIHDDTLERTTNGFGLVCDYTLQELQKLDAGNGEKIPSLLDVIDMVGGRCRLFIELKAENSVLPVAKILTHSVQNLGWSYAQFVVMAFNHPQIVEMRKIIPEINTCALLAGIPVSYAAIAQEAGAWSLNPCIHHINQELVDDAHARGLKILVWTCDSEQEIANAKSLKVDGIFSNFPDRIF